MIETNENLHVFWIYVLPMPLHIPNLPVSEYPLMIKKLHLLKASKQ